MLAWPGRLLRQVPGNQLLHAVARIGLAAGQAFVQQTGQRIDVGAGIGDAGAEAFGSHVGERADDRAGLGQLGGRDVVGDAEVDQVDEVAPGHQRVGWLDVAVHQPDGMRGVQRGGQLLNDVHGPWRAHRAVAPQQTGYVDALDDRHRQIQSTVDFAGLINRDDVRLGQPGGGVGLAPEPLLITRFGRRLGRQHLDGDIAIHHGVVGLVHLAHAAGADQRQQPVAPERHFIHGAGPSPGNPAAHVGARARITRRWRRDLNPGRF